MTAWPKGKSSTSGPKTTARVRLGPLGQRDYPQRVIDETWVVIGSDGVTETSVGTMRDLDGDLIGYSELKDGVYTYSDLTSEVYFDMPMGIGLGYAEWVKGRFGRHQHHQSDGS